jgi:hypothetical protein
MGRFADCFVAVNNREVRTFTHGSDGAQGYHEDMLGRKGSTSTK